jgi:hypothetical protein
VLTVLGFAAYIALRSPAQPATSFRVAVSSGAQPARPAPAPPQSPSASTQPVVQDTRLPAAPPAIVRTTDVTRRNSGFVSRRHAVAQLRSATDFAAPDDQTVASPAQQPLAPLAPGAAPAGTSGPGIQVIAGNVPPAAPAAPATPASAVLLPHGSIMLNGKPAVQSTALFPGDRVQVPGDAYASINGNGSLTVLQPGSSVVYTDKGLDLQQGGVAVSTLTGMPVNSEGLSIVPRSSHGKYDVLDENGAVQIASLEGDLNIMDGGKATLLPAGQQTRRDRRKLATDAPADTPAPETPPASASGGFPTGKVLLISGAVAGGVVAAVLLTRSSSKPVSPAVP